MWSVWDRSDRQSVKTQVLLFFILALVFGTSALTTASFATQVMMTQKAAASVIKNSDAPGLKYASFHQGEGKDCERNPSSEPACVPIRLARTAALCSAARESSGLAVEHARTVIGTPKWRQAAARNA
jgi:hypothetical protein